MSLHGESNTDQRITSAWHYHYAMEALIFTYQWWGSNPREPITLSTPYKSEGIHWRNPLRGL